MTSARLSPFPQEFAKPVGIVMRQESFLYVALAVAVAGCGSASSDKVGAEAPAFTTDVVKRQDLVGYAFFSGKLVIPDSAQAVVNSPYDAPVMSVMTGVGKHVLRGQEMLMLVVPGTVAATTAAKSDVASAAGSLAAQRGVGSPEVREARLVLVAAESAEKAAKEAGVQEDIDATTAARKEAATALDRAKADFKRTLIPANQAISAASSTLADAKADAAKGIVRAPIAGTVVSFTAKSGMAATASSQLATIIDYRAVRVQGMVPAEFKDLVVKRSPVIIAMEGANSDPLDGTVVDVTVMPPKNGQFSSGYLAEIMIKNPGAKVLPNMMVKRIGVKVGAMKQALVVPVGAVTTKDGVSTVQRRSGETWMATTITTGMSDGALVVVKSGLKAGDEVRVRTNPEVTK